MPGRFDVPRAVVRLALVLVVVPALLWLFVAWDTRPVDPAEVEADRARPTCSGRRGCSCSPPLW